MCTSITIVFQPTTIVFNVKSFKNSHLIGPITIQIFRESVIIAIEFFESV